MAHPGHQQAFLPVSSVSTTLKSRKKF